jgi:glycosyltransferase involved in cell wall biosynthesis
VKPGVTVTPGVTVVVPVYDEERTLEDVVETMLAELERLALPHEVLILDDGSRDGSPAAAASLAARAPERVRSVAFPENRGKGALLDDAFRRIETELAVVVDADGEYAARDLPAVLEPLVAGRADWVLGSRYGFGRPRPPQYRATWAVNRAVNAWFAALSGVRLNDLLTGLYAFRTALVRDLRLVERRFAYTPELMWKVLRRGPPRIVEVPVSYRFRDYAAGKKIRWWETGTILAATVRYKFRDGAA